MITQQILEPTADPMEVELLNREIRRVEWTLRELIARRDALTASSRLRPMNTDDLCRT